MTDFRRGADIKKTQKDCAYCCCGCISVGELERERERNITRKMAREKVGFIELYIITQTPILRKYYCVYNIMTIML